MLLTQETDYALRIMRSLSEGGSLSMQELSEREALPQNFAYKIAKKLEKAGMLRITRGVNGGCTLSCDLRKVSFYDLIAAVEKRAVLSGCMISDYDCQWREGHAGICSTHNRLCLLQKEIENEFRSRSLFWVLGGEDGK
ncbi:MAG: Rrf2 family transcriptional regulator [Lachnospiraceae bacterium]|jgi:Rrf2 family protein|nr:Rrf2 family transcriptional regulator [Lachnospiraceae bacterium]